MAQARENLRKTQQKKSLVAPKLGAKAKGGTESKGSKQKPKLKVQKREAGSNLSQTSLQKSLQKTARKPDLKTTAQTPAKPIAKANPAKPQQTKAAVGKSADKGTDKAQNLIPKVASKIAASLGVGAAMAQESEKASVKQLATEAASKLMDSPKTQQIAPKQMEPQPPFAAKKQAAPGLEKNLTPAPKYQAPLYKAAAKLEGKKAIITGGDSGIGRAVAVLYAREGADIAITYLKSELPDAQVTKKAVEAEGRKCILIEGDLSKAEFCEEVIKRSLAELGGIDILVSNAAHQMRKQDIGDITTEEWEYTFKTNIEAYFLLSKYAIPHMKPGSAIIATTSETEIFGAKNLLDYSATKGAISAFTRSLAQNLIEKGIRVNAVAPGPVWTPLNPSDQGNSQEKISKFGSQTPYGRPAQPEEIAPAYVFLASQADSSYITGVVLPELGGETVH